MKTKNMSAYIESAKECANYIFDSDAEQISYQEYIQEGNDPRDHILFHAAVVLDKADEFDIDISEYHRSMNNV